MSKKKILAMALAFAAAVSVSVSVFAESRILLIWWRCRPTRPRRKSMTGLWFLCVR